MPNCPHPCPPAQDVLRALLAVLMNLTQDSRDGAAAVVAAGALQPVAALLAQMVRGGPKMRGVAGGREELAVWLDELRCGRAGAGAARVGFGSIGRRCLPRTRRAPCAWAHPGLA